MKPAIRQRVLIFWKIAEASNGKACEYRAFNISGYIRDAVLKYHQNSLEQATDDIAISHR